MGESRRSPSREDDTFASVPKTLTGAELELDDAPARESELFIVDGNNLLNLQHGVVLEVSDPGLIRQTRPRKDSLRQALVSFGFGEPVFSPAEETTPGKPGFGS